MNFVIKAWNPAARPGGSIGHNWFFYLNPAVLLFVPLTAASALLFPVLHPLLKAEFSVDLVPAGTRGFRYLYPLHISMRVW